MSIPIDVGVAVCSFSSAYLLCIVCAVLANSLSFARACHDLCSQAIEAAEDLVAICSAIDRKCQHIPLILISNSYADFIA